MDASSWWEGRKKLGTSTGTTLHDWMLKKKILKYSVMMYGGMMIYRPKIQEMKLANARKDSSSYLITWCDKKTAFKHLSTDFTCLEHHKFTSWSVWTHLCTVQFQTTTSDRGWLHASVHVIIRKRRHKLPSAIHMLLLQKSLSLQQTTCLASNHKVDDVESP